MLLIYKACSGACVFFCSKCVVAFVDVGITTADIAATGVTFSIWLDWGYDVHQLVFLGATWNDIKTLGFSKHHIVNHRDKAGPAVLAGPPLNVTFAQLQNEIGVTIDDAVNKLKFTTADFALLGETVESLVLRGFNSTHVQTMGEPASNYTLAFQASAKELSMIGLSGKTEYKPTVLPARRASNTSARLMY